MCHTAYIALGSNLGDREASIRDALTRLGEEVRVTRVSRLYPTAAVGGPPGSPEFLNAAAALETNLPPTALLELLLRTEVALGRVRDLRWGPRTIDLDLLLYDQLILQLPQLQLPHPRLAERRFVLEPLNEIAPEAIHPLLGLRVSELLQRLD
jgi:2-amino-4-hydroxy-6-hydroxymethyldihydropteridine diphosphokinase